MKRIVFLFTTFLWTIACFAQTELQQTVRGTIKSADPNNEIYNASLIVLGTSPLIGATSDEKGEFFMKVPLGRHTLEVRCIGFSSQIIDVLVTSGREVVLDIVLEPTSFALEEVSIVAPYDKSKPINKLSFAGARSFSTEETYRFAGSLGDPARMVRNFAGVMPLNDSRNDIIIRGNSPVGVQWVLDGIEIANPNHFNAGVGMTGGQVTFLNTNLLSNSDFHLSAWPSPYGNALAGIFDLNMRSGNNKKREYWIQLGWNGLEAGAEGYFNKNKNSSYLVSYRYSIPDIMKRLGIMMPIVPKYQDLTFKMDFELNNKHSLSVLGLWGYSNIAFEFDENMKSEFDLEKDLLTFDQSVKIKSLAYILGTTHKAKLSSKTDWQNTLSFVRSDTQMLIDTMSLVIPNSKYETYWHEEAIENKYSLHSRIDHRFNYNSRIHAGIRYDFYDFLYLEKVSDHDYPEKFRVVNDEKGRFSLWRAYTQYQFNTSERLSLTAGLFGMYMSLNDSYSIEPRAGLQYRPHSSHTIGLAGGMYSQMQPRVFYFLRTPTADGFAQYNKQLDFSRSVQVDAYYDWAFASNWHAKAEFYFQHLYKIPVLDEEDGIFTMLEAGGAGGNSIQRESKLVNKGTGRNYGMEFTIEKFFSDNYYLLFNSTIYSSTYTNGFNNNRWSTIFDGRFLLNLAAGYEWELPKNFALFADLKSSLAGGSKYTPVLAAESKALNEIVLDKTKANTLRTKNYFRTDIRLGVRFNQRRLMHEWAIDLQNVTNRKNVYGVIYDIRREKFDEMLLQGFMPMVTYKLHFSF